MADEEANEHFVSCTLPKDSIITGQILVVSFLNAEGAECWDVRIGTDMTQVQIIGLLEMAKNGYLS